MSANSYAASIQSASRTHFGWAIRAFCVPRETAQEKRAIHSVPTSSNKGIWLGRLFRASTVLCSQSDCHQVADRQRGGNFNTATNMNTQRSMENGICVPTRAVVIERIESLAAAFVEYLTTGQIMEMETLRRTLDAMSYDEEKKHLVHNQETRLLRLNRCGARKYTSVWLVLQTVHELLVERKTVTQRELYYMHPFFRSQTEADEAIIDTGCLLGVPRSSLNIFGATKGCFSGSLRILRASVWKNYDDNDEHPITQQILQLEDVSIASDATCIIVIEKDGIFNRLREDRFTNRLPSILVTGRGFPDLATRIFVSRLQSALRIPVYGLCDCNPFGVSIMLTYRIGSARMPLDSRHFTIDIRWIGLHPSIISQLQLPSTALKALTSKDLNQVASLSSSPFIKTQPAYQAQLEYWSSRMMPFKVELEALHALGFGFLADFVERSIIEDSYI